MSGRRYRSERPLVAGDTFAVPLGDAVFGAVRIIRVCEEEDTALVAVAPWVGPVVPTGNEPELRTILREYRGGYRGAPAVFWYQGRPPREFVHIAAIPPSEDELALDTKGAYGGKWHWTMARRALWERGMEVARPVRKPTRKSKEISRLELGIMPEPEFWRVISMVDYSGKDGSGDTSRAVTHLASLNVTAITAFEERLSERLYALDREVLARNIGVCAYGGPHFSADTFLYARCAVVACGQEFFDAVLASPDRMPKDIGFEPLLMISDLAHRKKTGKALSFEPRWNYETFSNKEGWNVT